MVAPRILVAENDSLVAADLRENLERMGYDVAAIVGSGDEAPDAAMASGADLAILDVRMPGSADGIEAGRRIRESMGIPIIYLSAYADRFTVDRAKGTGPMAYLVKPYDPRELRTAIEVALERHLAEKALEQAESRYRELFQATPTPLVLSSSEGRIRDVNRSFLQWFGGTRDEVVGFTENEIGLWRSAEARQGMIADLEAHGATNGLEAAFRTRASGDRMGEVHADVVYFGPQPQILIAIRDITEGTAHEEDLTRLALLDPLTGLPNRRLFHDRLEHALSRARRDGSGVAVLFLDLDRFKQVNDSFGHAAGDQVLTEAATRIQGCVRAQDTVARLGGDEFAVVLSDVDRVASVEEAIRRVIQGFQRPMQVAGVEVSVGASVGAAIAFGGTLSAEALLRFSDGAMYRAKSQGGGTYRIFDPALDAIGPARRQAPQR